MTLIVGKKINDNIFLISDTRLIDNQDEKLHFDITTDNRQKIFILNPQLVVAFAGGEYNADLAFNEIVHLNDKGKIISILLKYHKDSLQHDHGITEFVLAIGIPEFKILLFQNGEIKEVNNFWLGSKTAFSLYQKTIIDKKSNIESYPLEPRQDPNSFDIISDLGFILVPSSLNDNNDEFSNSYRNSFDAISRIILNNDVREVGGFCIPVAYDRGEFGYIPYSKSYYGKQTVPFIPNEPQTYFLSMGVKESGSHIVNLLRGVESEKNFLAFYITHGDFGVIFKNDGNGFPRPVLYSNCNAVEFSFVLKTEYSLKNLPSVPFGFMPEQFDFLAKKYYDEENFLKALEVLCEAEKHNLPEFYVKPMLCNKADILNKLKDYKGAINNYFSALPIEEPQLQEIAYTAIGLAFLHLKKYRLSIIFNTYAIDANPNNIDAYFNRYLGYWELAIKEKSLDKLNLAKMDLDYASILGFNSEIISQCLLQYNHLRFQLSIL